MSRGILILQSGHGAIDGSWHARLGITVIRVLAYAPDLDTAINAPPIELGITIPEWRPRSFTRRVEGEGYDVTLSFEGHQTPDTADGTEYSLDGTTSEDHIESHPNFDEISKVYGGNLDDNGRLKFQTTLPDGKHKNPMFGAESYYNAGIVWTRTRVAPNLDASISATLGKIDNPPGNSPPLVGNQNWIKIRARATFRGNVWQIEESWMRSGPDGWVPEVYKYSAAGNSLQGQGLTSGKL